MNIGKADTIELNIENKQISLTHPLKIIWPEPKITKLQFIQYLIEVSPYILPFLKDRALTTIRYPHGVGGEFFFQKNCPTYAPNYVQRHVQEETKYIVCQNLATLVWLANQLAIEMHIPFQPIQDNMPSELVFDIDPPARQQFGLAVEAALILKEILDSLGLISFLKISGNKGLQIYIPLPRESISYPDSRLILQFLCTYLVEKKPSHFTMERLIKNRQNKVYLDYVQHAPNKTIIAPYSVRANQEGLVATPLEWDEVNDTLSPTTFTMNNVLNRLQTKPCPFSSFEQVRNKQDIQSILDWLRTH